MAAAPPLTIWAVSDGQAGIEAQVEGLAQALARQRPAELVVKRIGWRYGLGRLPARLNPGILATLTPGGGVAPPWPDIWVAAGRATLPLSMRLRRRSRGKTFVVQVQDPRVRLDAFDVVAPPVHDDVSGPNVVSIVGSPTRLTPARLAADYARFGPALDPLPRPRVAVVVGGKSKVHDLSPGRAAAMGAEIAATVARAGGSVMVSFTRRTPEAARQILTAKLSPLPGVIWDERSENPYFAYLAAADAILVTEDSTNLATDAAAAGKPVYVLAMDGHGGKFRLFHEDLARRGISRPFEGRLESWSYPPFVETDRAAAEILARYDAARS